MPTIVSPSIIALLNFFLDSTTIPDAFVGMSSDGMIANGGQKSVVTGTASVRISQTLL